MLLACGQGAAKHPDDAVGIWNMMQADRKTVAPTCFVGESTTKPYKSRSDAELCYRQRSAIWPQPTVAPDALFP
eukprot:5588892-Amphidinium_carterae.2